MRRKTTNHGRVHRGDKNAKSSGTVPTHVDQVALSSVLSDASYTVRNIDIENGEVKYGSIGKHLDTSTETSSRNDAIVHKGNCCKRGQKDHPKINNSDVPISGNCTVRFLSVSTDPT
jgi:hypothetical protein